MVAKPVFEPDRIAYVLDVAHYRDDFGFATTAGGKIELIAFVDELGKSWDVHRSKFTDYHLHCQGFELGVHVGDGFLEFLTLDFRAVLAGALCIFDGDGARFK